MYNQQQYANIPAGNYSLGSGSNSITIPSPKPPAQRPSEFAANVLKQAEDLNTQLKQLRFRIFGESEPEAANGCTQSEMSIEATIQAAHYALNGALDQLQQIHNRL
jgi:hypothetical protein